MNDRLLKKYAKLIIKVGANVKKGQDVIINCDVENVTLARELVSEAYKAGAKRVVVEWSDSPILKMGYINQSEETLCELPLWNIEKLKYIAEKLPVMVYIDSKDPDALNGVDQEKIKKARVFQYPKLKPYQDKMENKYQWVIAAAPSVAWAKKVFPDLKDKAAVEKLWDLILNVSRCSGKDPIKNWKEHDENLAMKCKKLNDYDFDFLHFTNSLGTDLKVKLLPKSIFCGGGETTLKGRFFNPNIPTEECFSVPDKFGVDGIVYSTKPLSYGGELIEDFSLRFEKGKVVEVKAKRGEELLKKMVSMDEGASYLGEVALVPYDSPISQSNTLFYKTLFDENASCHLALGRGFTNCIKNYEKMTEREIKDCGVNESMIHVDFMIGSKDLNIVGVTHKKEKIQVFKDGTWAI